MVRQTPEYEAVLSALTARVVQGKAADFEHLVSERIGQNWDIGRIIAEAQAEFGWDDSVVEVIAADLREAFPEIADFSARNVGRMRVFYETYRRSRMGGELLREVGWAQHLLILAHCTRDAEREFYLKLVQKYGWGYIVLEHYIERELYEMWRAGLSDFDEGLNRRSR